MSTSGVGRKGPSKQGTEVGEIKTSPEEDGVYRSKSKDKLNLLEGRRRGAGGKNG